MRTVRSVQLQTRRIQLKGFTTRKQDSKRPEQITEDTPANPGRLLGVGGSAGDTGFGLRTNDRAPRRGRPSRKLEERTASPGSPETIERTAGCGRQSPEPQPGEGVAPAPASKPIPTGAGDDPEPRSRRRRSASRVIRVQATEPSEARTRAQAGYGTALRSTAESAGRMRSVERQIRSPEKLTGASRKATRGSVAPGPRGRCWPASRRWQKIPLTGRQRRYILRRSHSCAPKRVQALKGTEDYHNHERTVQNEENHGTDGSSQRGRALRVHKPGRRAADRNNVC